MATVDVPNAIVQTDQPKGKDGERAVMKIVGHAVAALLKVAPEICGKYVV